METLNLPNMRLDLKGNDIQVIHTKTKTKTSISVKQLEAWVLRKLREELVPGGKQK